MIIMKLKPHSLHISVIERVIQFHYSWFDFIAALYGCFFHDNQEPAFSNYRLWESLGFVVAFAYSNFLCVSVKLYLLIINLVIGIALYFVSELLHRKKEQEAKDWQKEKEDFGMKIVDKEEEKAWRIIQIHWEKNTSEGWSEICNVVVLPEKNETAII